MAKDVSKGNMLQKICRHYSIDINNVVAVGDNLNDIDMIMKAGIGIAVGNAHDKLKAVADDITFTNENNGFAHICEKYIG